MIFERFVLIFFLLEIVDRQNHEHFSFFVALQLQIEKIWVRYFFVAEVDILQ